MSARPPVLTLTPAAIDRVKFLMNQRGKPSYGIRISVRTKGCSGLAYALEFANDLSPQDELIEVEGVRVLIDPKAIMFILGAQMDYREEQMAAGFVFTNPNEKGRCGCGESFHV